jgi:hypothetical protein
MMLIKLEKQALKSNLFKCAICFSLLLASSAFNTFNASAESSSKVKAEEFLKVRRSKKVNIRAKVTKIKAPVTISNKKGEQVVFQEISVRSLNKGKNKIRNLRFCLSNACGKNRSNVDQNMLSSLSTGDTIQISGSQVNSETVLVLSIDNLYPEYVATGTVVSDLSEPKSNSFGVTTRFFYLNENSENSEKKVLVRLCVANCNMINIKQTQFEMDKVKNGAQVEILGLRASAHIFNAENIKVVNGSQNLNPQPQFTSTPANTSTPVKTMAPQKTQTPSNVMKTPVASPSPTQAPVVIQPVQTVTATVAAPTPSPLPSASPSASASSDFNEVYTSFVRSAGTGSQSQGSGVAALALSDNGQSAIITYKFSNLSSAVTGIELRGPADEGQNAGVIVNVLSLQQIQQDAYLWQIQPAIGLSIQDIANAIKNGKVYINVLTQNFQNGEIRGSFTNASNLLK